MAGHYIYKKQIKNKSDGKSTHWSEKKKWEVVTMYARTGNQDLTCKLTGVPEPTLVHWRKADWFKDMLAEIRSQESDRNDTKMTGIIERALDAVEDRLVHGDYILDSKTGTIKRIPPKMKDTAQVLDKIIEKRQLIRKEPTKITENVSKLEDQLKKIANQFEILVRGRTPVEIEAEEVEYIERNYDAVHEERETGLQNREREVQFQTHGEEETSSSQQCEGTNG